MRLNINEELVRKLEEIREKEGIYGRRYENVISFLIKHYEATKSIDDQLSKLIDRLESELQVGLKNAFANLIRNLIAGGTRNEV